MMTTALTLSFEGSLIRTVTGPDGEVSWVVADVCKAIGLTSTESACARLDEDEKGLSDVKTLGGMQPMVTVNESGIYHLVMSSKQERAKRFRKWLTKEVIPCLRRHGRYDQSLANDTPEMINLIESNPMVASCRKLLEVSQEQVRQKYRLEQVEQEQQVLTEQIREVDAKADVAVDRATKPPTSRRLPRRPSTTALAT